MALSVANLDRNVLQVGENMIRLSLFSPLKKFFVLTRAKGCCIGEWKISKETFDICQGAWKGMQR